MYILLYICFCIYINPYICLSLYIYLGICIDLYICLLYIFFIGNKEKTNDNDIIINET